MTSGAAELAGLVALVTGASRNIGRCIALELGAAGAVVGVNARSSRTEAEAVVGEITAAGGRAATVIADIAAEDAVLGMVAEVVGRFGGIDILVNNAAIRHEAPLEALSFAEWRAAMATMLDGAFLCAKACLPHLRASRRASIINIGGMTAHTGAQRRAHVIAAKAGLEGLTRALALELASEGITVNCVAPGMIDTVRGGSAGTAHHHASRVLPLGHRAPPSEVAAMVRHLCGPAARFITGQVLHVNGGVYLGG